VLLVDYPAAGVCFGRPGLSAVCWFGFRNNSCVDHFSIWDVVGILRDHWSYSHRFTTGWKLSFGMPIEELVFFIVVPICGLLTYEAVGHVLRLLQRRARVGEAGPHA
jgi:lycopene cyclase domain-containing protein